MSRRTPSILFPFLFLLPTVLLIGCTQDDVVEACGWSATLEESPDRPVFNLTDDFLAQHPSLQELFSKPGIEGGTGLAVDCDEGTSDLRALEGAGAQVRWFDSGGGDAAVLRNNQTYLLSMAFATRQH